MRLLAEQVDPWVLHGELRAGVGVNPFNRCTSARYRVQLWLLILGVLAPWIGNMMYIFGWVPLPGLDMTPVAFSITGVCFVASVFSAKH